jgi:hypothetical protein
MLSHGNALSFVDWCSTVSPSRPPTGSSHAPFHFDLSILDIYPASSTARRSCSSDRRWASEPPRPGAADRRASASAIWYSAPSILGLLAQFGKLDRLDYSALRHRLLRRRGLPGQAFLRRSANSGRARATSTSTGRPRRTSAPGTRSRRSCRTNAPDAVPDRPGLFAPARTRRGRGAGGPVAPGRGRALHRRART